MAKISGPYRGYFMVTTALAVDGRSFVGRTQITTSRPEAGQRPEVQEQVTSAVAYDSPERAMQASEFQAREILDGMVPCWEPFTVPGILS